MSYKRIIQFPSFDPSEEDIYEMAVTIKVWGREEIRRVNIDEHCYLNEQDAIDRIKEIYKSGKAPFIIAR